MKKNTEHPVIWLQLSCCSGCSVSALNAASPTIKNLLIDQVVPGSHVNLRFHPTLMAGSGEPVLEIMEGTETEGGYILVIEGSVPTAADGAYGGVGELRGKELTMHDKTVALARNAAAVVCLGTCSAFGGIFAAGPNPGGCKSVGAVLAEAKVNTPVINIPGCAPHPDWFVGTVADILLNGLPGPDKVDDFGRPLAFYGELVHENCPRRGDFDAGKFAKKLGDGGCLYRLGCKGPMTYSDCPNRQWNGGVNWPIKNNHPCIGCVEPGFPDHLAPMFEKLTDERLERFYVKTR